VVAGYSLIPLGIGALNFVARPALALDPVVLNTQQSTPSGSAVYPIKAVFTANSPGSDVWLMWKPDGSPDSVKIGSLGAAPPQGNQTAVCQKELDEATRHLGKGEYLVRLFTGVGPTDYVDSSPVVGVLLWEPDPVALVQWVEVYQGQLDTNPNGGGKRIFPDRDSPGGSKTDYVKVQVKIKYPGLTGESIPVKVWIETPSDPGPDPAFAGRGSIAKKATRYWWLAVLVTALAGTNSPAVGVQAKNLALEVELEETEIVNGGAVTLTVTLRNLANRPVNASEVDRPTGFTVFRQAAFESGPFQQVAPNRPGLYPDAQGGVFDLPAGQSYSMFEFFSTGRLGGEPLIPENLTAGPMGGGLFLAPGRYVIRVGMEVKDWPREQDGSLSSVYDWVWSDPVSFHVRVADGADGRAYQYLQKYPEVWHLLNWDAAERWQAPDLVARGAGLERFLAYYPDCVYAKYARVSLLSFYQRLAIDYSQARYWQKIVRVGDRLLRDSPAYLPAMVHLSVAKAQFALGKTAEGKRHAQAALDSNPTTEVAETARHLLAPVSLRSQVPSEREKTIAGNLDISDFILPAAVLASGVLLLIFMRWRQRRAGHNALRRASSTTSIAPSMPRRSR